MRQLSGVDASFLNMETSTQFGHVSSIIVLDPDGTDGHEVYAELKRTVEERLHLLGIYRRKLVADPLGLDNPYWVDDPDLDLEFHIREIALAKPGDDRQFAEQVARLMARPLDRSRPLWEWYVISGLEDGSVALFSKLHHATIDGASGVELIQVLLDTEPGGRTVDAPSEPWEPERTPTPVELLGRALWSYALRPQKMARIQMRMLRAGPKLAGSSVAREMVTSMVRPPTGYGRATRTDPAARAPATPFNRTISAHRRVAFCTLRLSDAQTVKRTFGVTVNDVVMALCGTALRTYLIGHDALPAEPLTAMVPISVRTGDEADPFSTVISAATCSLHTDLEDPVDRLMAIHESMAAAKELQRAIPADVMTDMTQFTPPGLAARASRLAGSIRIADHMRPPANVVISNVPGPRQPLYLSGRTMSHLYPVSTVIDGMGLNMTVQSYLDNLDFGLLADRELVPDLWDLCDLLPPAMDELLAAAAAAGAAQIPPAPAKKPPGRSPKKVQGRTAKKVQGRTAKKVQGRTAKKPGARTPRKPA